MTDVHALEDHPAGITRRTAALLPIVPSKDDYAGNGSDNDAEDDRQRNHFLPRCDVRIYEMSKIVKTPDCVIQKQPDGSRVCALHGKPLQQQNMFGPANPSGPGHLSAWVCPVSGKMLIEMERL
jgi:hypothetical protein